ncbi:hypothetical protein LAY57_19820, partial [Argonema antarcticum A004/B2]|nr:hypothetical protein [Argonema antarcticum A004/B2]
PTPTPEPVVEPTPTPTPEPVVEAKPTPTPEPVVEPTPTPTPEPVVEAKPTPTPEPVVEAKPTPTTTPTPKTVAPTAPKASEKPRFGGFFNRFRRSDKAQPSPTPTAPNAIAKPTPPLTPSPAVQKPEISPEPKALTPETPSLEPTKLEEKESSQGESFDRLKNPSAVELQPSPSLPPTLPEIIETPTPESIAPSTPASPPETPIEPKAEQTETPQEAKSAELDNSASIPTIIEVESPPTLSSTLPEIIDTPTPEEISVRPKSLPQIDPPASQTEPKAEVTKTPEPKPNKSVETAQASPNSSGISKINQLFQRLREPRTPIQ